MKCIQKDLKKCDCTIYMDMNITTLPKEALKARLYSMDMNKEDHIVTLPKKGLKTRPYSMDMNKEKHIVTLPKKGLKTRPYNIGMEKMEKKDLEKLTKEQLIKLLLKQKKSMKVNSNHEDLLDNDPFKDEVAQELPWIRGSKERSSQNSHPQDERAKGEEPLVTLDHNLVLEPVRLHVKLLCQDKRGAPI